MTEGERPINSITLGGAGHIFSYNEIRDHKKNMSTLMKKV
jgi:hypothetical protein